MSFYQYKNILGAPGEGTHSYRIANIAIVDVALTFILALVLAKLFSWNYWITLLCLFLVGILLHRIFCVRTTVDKLLFP